jgi:uncharacterized protein YodC (DUF2158 family)
MDEIKVGDVVQLRSGGCRMTVTEVKQATTAGEGTRAQCDWFEDTDSGGQKREYGYFPIAALRKVE